MIDDMFEYDKDAAVKVAEDAAGIIDAGWHKGSITDGKGRYCAMGALRKAASGQSWRYVTEADFNFGEYHKVASTLSKIVAEEYPGSLSFIGFNDSIAKSSSEVSDLFRKAAKEIANEG